MRRRSIFLRKSDSLFPVEEVFTDHKNYYKTLLTLLIDESISFYANSIINDEFFKQKIKDKLSQAEDKELIGLEIQNYEKNKAERFTEFSIHYPHYFRCYFLSQTYSFIDNELRLLCLEHATNHGIVLNHKMLSAYPKIQQYINYQWPDMKNKISAELIFLDMIRHIRNEIIHSSGIVDLSRKENIEEMWEFDHDFFHFEEIGEEEFQISITNDALIMKLISIGESLFKKLLEEITS